MSRASVDNEYDPHHDFECDSGRGIARNADHTGDWILIERENNPLALDTS